MERGAMGHFSFQRSTWKPRAGATWAPFLPFFWQKKGAAEAPLLQLLEALALLPFPALEKANERCFHHLALHPCLSGSACLLAAFSLPKGPGKGGAAGAASHKAVAGWDLFPFHSYPLPSRKSLGRGAMSHFSFQRSAWKPRAGAAWAPLWPFCGKKKGFPEAPLLQLPKALAPSPFPTLGKANERHLRWLGPHACLSGSARLLAGGFFAIFLAKKGRC